jgi:hypothetical protein
VINDEAATPQASGTVVELVAWLREQIEASLWLPWHLPDCQMLKPVPEGLTRAIIGDTFSCNCALQTAMFNQYRAHTAILELHPPGRTKGCAECSAERVDIVDDTDPYDPVVEYYRPYPCRTLRALALVYQHNDGYREEWRP